MNNQFIHDDVNDIKNIAKEIWYDSFVERQISGEKYLISMYYIKNCEWDVINLVPVKNLRQESVVLRNFTAFFSVVAVLIAILLTMFLSQLDLIVGDLNVSYGDSRRRSYLPQLRDAILDKIVRGHIRDREQIVEFFRDMEIPLSREEYKCSLLMLEGDYSIDDITVNFIGNLVERIFKGDYDYVLFSDSANNLVLITSPKEERSIIYDRLIILRENIMHYLKTDVSIYSGKTYSGAENIHASYHDIIQLLKYRYIFSEKVIDFSDMEKTGFTMDSSVSGSIQDIIDAMKMNDRNKLAVSLKAYIARISKEEDTIKSLKKNCIAIITEVLRFCIDLNFDAGSIIDHSESMFIKLNEMNDAGNILKWVYDELVGFSEKINEVRKNKTEKLASSVMKFIENNYSDYNLSVSYISDVFKHF